MADNVKWIQMKVGMFDGNSFKRIKRAKIGGISYRDKLTSVWFELMDLAGKSNRDGFLIDGNGIPFQCDDYEDIAVMIDRDAKEVELCMQFYMSEKMVEIIDDMYCLPNFVKYQAVDGLTKIREQGRLRTQQYRERIKANQRTQIGCDVTCDAPVTQSSISNSNILITSEEIKDIFLVLWQSYPTKKDNVQALKTLTNKISGLTLTEAKEKSNKIWSLMQERINDDWSTCDPKYIPHFSSWLNKEVPDKRKPSGATTKGGNK